MQVDISHRNIDFTLTMDDYLLAADALASGLSVHPAVNSIVLCGSMAKGDLIPGWSDIDIIVFCNTGSIGRDFLLHANELLQMDVMRRIGIGFDPCELDDFLRHGKIGGRPKMMTYEVAAYGTCLFGENPFLGIRYDEAAATEIELERRILIAAEVHSARRLVANMTRDLKGTQRAAHLLAKSLLRLLQCETGPNLAPPISTLGSLTRFGLSHPGHPALPAFAAASSLRSNWSLDVLAQNADRLFELFVNCLSTYPLHDNRHLHSE